MCIARAVRLAYLLFFVFLLATGPGWVPMPTPLAVAGPPIPTSGRLTSVVPPPPQVVQKFQQEGRPLPPLDQWKVHPTPALPRRLTGTVNLLVIMVDFSDRAGTVTNLGLFNSLVFAPPSTGRGSVRDYYDEVSRAGVTLVTLNPPQNLGWQRVPSPYSYYAGGNYGMGPYPQNAGRMVEDLIPLVDAMGVDFSQYDNDGDGLVDTLLVIHAGTGAEFSLNTGDIWSHAASISLMGGAPQFYDGVVVDNYVTTPEYWNPALVSPSSTDMTIGVACHEVAHGLWGLPDLYDLDTSSYGIGQWGLMSYGDWNGPPKWNPFIGQWVTDGSSPAWPEAWSRLVVGFENATLALGPFEATFYPVETTANAVFRFKTIQLRAQEDFLVENRQRIVGSYDEYLPAGGLLIWHIDEARWWRYGGNDNDSECGTIPHCSGACAGSHYLVSLEQADRFDHLERKLNVGDGGDPFPGSTGNTSFRPYPQNPVNPESGSWYDSGCGTDSCLSLSNITCTILGNCGASVASAACGQAEADLGDAPASQNSYGVTMTAYAQPPVLASFPTVYLLPASAGPRHHFTSVDSWLGSSTTGELNADRLPDMDGVTNLDPPNDAADRDSVASPAGRDDGLQLPLPLVHCAGQVTPLTLTIVSPIVFTPPTRYINMWVDWNHDGDWNDTLPCPAGPPAAEWAIRDMALALGPGVYPLAPAPITTWVTVAENMPWETWLRLSVAEQPAPSPYDGRGPAQGYDLGETEDYYLWLQPALLKSADLAGDPAPGEQVTYYLNYSAAGNVVAANAVLSDVLPLGVEFVSANPPAPYDPSTRTVFWSIAIAPNQPFTATLTVQVTGSPGDTVTNTAYLLWGGNIWARSSFGFSITCPPGGEPQAAFTWEEPACAGEMVSFINESSGMEPLTFAWDLDGDGDVDSTSRDPVWQYSSAGSYTVTLTATNDCGTDYAGDLVTVSLPLSGASIVGPTFLLVGETGHYTATPLPPDATAPQYSWDNGQIGITTTYSWPMPGEYTIALTATNACSLVTTTLDVLVSSACTPLTGVAIDGPGSLLVGETGYYVAAPSPPGASAPQYSWDNGLTGITTTYSWPAPGEYTVALTATNACSLVSATLDVLVSSTCISLTGVTIAGPASLGVGEEGLYGAVPAPPTATNPAYLWNSGDTGASAVFSWTLPGEYTVSVMATNCQGAVESDALSVAVTSNSNWQIYLPIIVKGG